MEGSEMKGHLILVTAPMASGKGRLIAYVLSVFPQVTRLTSCTTRSIRPGEREDIDYHFIPRSEFEDKIKNGNFIEWAEFSDNLYGTLKSELSTRLKRGEIVINEIDIQGVLQLQKIVPKEQCTVVYVDAGNWETLKARALARAPISPEHLALRYERYLEETAFKNQADFIIENNDGQFEEAKANIHAVIEGIISKVASKT